MQHCAKVKHRIHPTRHSAPIKNGQHRVSGECLRQHSAYVVVVVVLIPDRGVASLRHWAHFREWPLAQSARHVVVEAESDAMNKSGQQDGCDRSADVDDIDKGHTRGGRCTIRGEKQGNIPLLMNTRRRVGIVCQRVLVQMP